MQGRARVRHKCLHNKACWSGVAHLKWIWYSQQAYYPFFFDNFGDMGMVRKIFRNMHPKIFIWITRSYRGGEHSNGKRGYQARPWTHKKHPNHVSFRYEKRPRIRVLHAFFLICLSCPFQNLSIWPKTHFFFSILHVFAPLNDVGAYIAWSWKTILITWIFGRAWYPLDIRVATPGVVIVLYRPVSRHRPDQSGNRREPSSIDPVLSVQPTIATKI